ASWFVRLGAELERADNTARLLDVKYHLLLPSGEEVGGPLDHAQWSTILDVVSARTAYRWIYRSGLKSWLVADLLIFRTEMPRSLSACIAEAAAMLARLSGQIGRVGPADRQARKLRHMIDDTNVKTIFQSGLHEFVPAFWSVI